MRITINNDEPTVYTLSIKADEQELLKSKDSILKKLSKKVKVPGFRTGHVPPAVAEKNIDPNLLQTEVLEHVMNNLYISAIRQEKLRPVDNPNISIKKFVPFSELEFEAKVSVIGTIKIADYKKIKHKKIKPEVTTKEIDDVINSLITRSSERKEVKRPSKMDDEVVLDFIGYDKKKQKISGADGKDYPLILGSGSFIPGFEEELIGLKEGQEKSFVITFPKDYQAKALQSKEVTFEVVIKKVSEMVAPKLDNNFAAAIGPFKTVEELRSDIKKQLELEKQREADSIFENELLQKIADKSEVEIPSILIDEQVERIETEEKQNIVYRGQTWQEHLEEEGVTEEEHKNQKKPAAEERVKIGIILSEIADKEAIEASAEEIEVRLQLLKGQYTDKLAQSELDKPEALRDIETRIRTEKTLQRLVDYATN